MFYRNLHSITIPAGVVLGSLSAEWLSVQLGLVNNYDGMGVSLIFGGVAGGVLAATYT